MQFIVRKRHFPSRSITGKYSFTLGHPLNCWFWICKSYWWIGQRYSEKRNHGWHSVFYGSSITLRVGVQYKMWCVVAWSAILQIAVWHDSLDGIIDDSLAGYWYRKEENLVSADNLLSSRTERTHYRDATNRGEGQV